MAPLRQFLPAIAVLGSAASAPALEFSPSKDVRILSRFSTLNFGGDSLLSFYNQGDNVQHSLIHFNLSTIPPGSSISTATLRITPHSTYPYTNGVPSYVYRATRSWVEMQATWLQASNGVTWTNPGGDFVGITGQYNQAPFATNTVTTVQGTPYLDYDVRDLVQLWVNGTENHGMLLRADAGNQFAFHSGTSATGPKLLVTVGGSSGAISGSVNLGTYSGPLNQVGLTFQVFGPSQSTHGVVLNSNGSYSFTSSNFGTVEITAEGPHWLRQRKGPYNFTTAGLSGINFTLINGDVQKDNEVNLGDYTALGAAFGSLPGDPNWNANADLNGDEEISLPDYTILAANFGQIGDD